MAAGSNIIREYLTALGFVVDEASYKKFNSAITKSAKLVTELGEQVSETGLAIAYMVDRSARQYEELYYMSQRTQQSVAFLKSYEFAARQVGVSQEAARASTEGFAQSLRTNIGLQGLAASLGIDQSKGPLGVVSRLKQVFGTSPAGYMIAQRFGSMFGIDERTFKQYFDNAEKLQKTQEEQEARQRRMGVGTKELSDKFFEFTQTLNQFEETLGNVRDRIAGDFVGPATSVVHVLDQILQKFGELDKESGGVLGGAAGLGGSALAAFALKKIIKSLVKRFGLSAAETGVSGLVTEAAGGLSLGGLAVGSAAWTAALFALLYPTNKTDNDAEEAARRMPPGGSIGARNNAGRTRGDRNNNPGNIEYGAWAVQHGAIGTDGRFAIFPDQATGQAAMDELLRKNYAGLSLAQIQRKWVGNEDRNYLGGMERATGLGANDVPNMSDPAVRRALIRGMTLGEGTTLGPSPIAAAGAQVNISHDTDINIHGPVSQDVAGQIFDAQNDVYSKAVRDALPRTR